MHDPVTGAARTSRFRVSGRAAFAPSFGTGGFGNGAALTVSGLLHAQCPAGGSACLQKAQQGLVYAVLLHAAPGPSGTAALARYAHQYDGFLVSDEKPTELVNFGQAVSFPLLFGAALSLFGAATLVHLLLVSVRRRRAETGLLKVLGFLRRQVAGPWSAGRPPRWSWSASWLVSRWASPRARPPGGCSPPASAWSRSRSFRPCR